MAVKTDSVGKDGLTAEMRAANKAESARKRLNRDRAKMLENVKTCITQAAVAIAAGDLPKHDKWLLATNSALTAYAEFAALTVEPSTSESEFTFPDAA